MGGRGAAAHAGAPALSCALLLASLVAGCANLPAPGSTSGRIAVRVDANGGAPARSVGASFDLLGDGERGELRLSGPLGSTVALGRWSPGDAVLVDQRGERRFADLDALSLETFGEALPLRALPDWIRGRPWSGAPSQPTADGFVQLGWQVVLARFAEGAIDAIRLAPPHASVRVRLDR